MPYFPKFLLREIPSATSCMIFNKSFFKHRIFESLLLFKSLIVTTEPESVVGIAAFSLLYPKINNI